MSSLIHVKLSERLPTMKIQAHSDSATSIGRLKIVLLALLFAAPVILASVLYSINWRPPLLINYGQLVQPAHPIQNVNLETLDGKPADFNQLRKKWTMLYFGSINCNQACEQTLYGMQWAQATQGREADRIVRVFIITDADRADMHQRHDALKKYSDMTLLTGTSENLTKLERQFVLPGAPASSASVNTSPVGAASGPPLGGASRIYLVDPNGNFMMSYPATANAKGISRDLNRLLKVSHIG